MTTRKPVRLWVKLSITMISVIVIALFMATTLNLLRFEETYERLVAQWLDVTAQEVARVVVTGLDLGLNIKAQNHLAAFVDTYEANHPEIAISIFDCSGEPVIGKNADASSRPWSDHAGAAQWRVFGEKLVGVGMMVEDNLGNCAAGLSVETTSARYVAGKESATRRFALTGALAAAAASLAVLGALFLFSRRNRLRKLDDDLVRLAAAAGDGVSSSALISESDFSDPWERMLARHYLDARPNLFPAESKNTKADAS